MEIAEICRWVKSTHLYKLYLKHEVIRSRIIPYLQGEEFHCSSWGRASIYYNQQLYLWSLAEGQSKSTGTLILKEKILYSWISNVFSEQNYSKVNWFLSPGRVCTSMCSRVAVLPHFPCADKFSAPQFPMQPCQNKNLIFLVFLSRFANAFAQGRWFEWQEICALAGGSFSSNCRLTNIVFVNWQLPLTALDQQGLEPAEGVKSMGPTFSFLTAAIITSFRRNFIRTNSSKSASELWPGCLSMLGSNCWTTAWFHWAALSLRSSPKQSHRWEFMFSLNERGEIDRGLAGAACEGWGLSWLIIHDKMRLKCLENIIFSYTIYK